MSKQWQRVIYRKQFDLEIEKYEFEKGFNSLNSLKKVYRYIYTDRTRLLGVHKKPLQTVLKKCPFIRRVSFDIDFNGKVLIIIGKYCRQLREFEFLDLSLLQEEWLLQFGRNFGHRLKNVRFWFDDDDNKEMVKKFLGYCPNIKSVNAPKEIFIKPDNGFLPALRDIRRIDFYDETDISDLKILADKYRKTIRKLTIYIKDMTGPYIRRCVQQISRLEKLISLSLLVESYEDFNSSIDESISQLVKNCKQLKELDIEFLGDHYYSDDFFIFLSDARSLEIVHVWLRSLGKKLSGSVKLFKQCSKLRRLSMAYIDSMEDFCEDIKLFLPNLTVLTIGSINPPNETFIASLSTMKHLQWLRFYSHISEIRQVNIIDYFFNKYLHKKKDETAIRELTKDCGAIDRGLIKL